MYCNVLCAVCVYVCVYIQQANLTASCCLRFVHVCLIYVCVPRGTPVPQHGIIFWPVGVYTSACCEPLMAGSQQVTRSELLTHHRDPSLPQHLGELYPWHWQTWVLLSAIWFHCLFLYTSKLILCQFCCQQWQKGARIHSNGMARRGIWGISRKRKENWKPIAKWFSLLLFLWQTPRFVCSQPQEGPEGPWWRWSNSNLYCQWDTQHSSLPLMGRREEATGKCR